MAEVGNYAHADGRETDASIRAFQNAASSMERIRCIQRGWSSRINGERADRVILGDAVKRFPVRASVCSLEDPAAVLLHPCSINCGRRGRIDGETADEDIG